ncbi:hypothetical protein IC582_009602 [Cucumis melo]
MSLIGSNVRCLTLSIHRHVGNGLVAIGKRGKELELIFGDDRTCIMLIQILIL